MPEKANIFWVEDYEPYLEMGRESMEWEDHKVLLTARTLDEALSLTPLLREKQIRAAIIDGNLTHTDESGLDGQRITAAIKKEFPELGIIGNGADPVLGADIQVLKSAGMRALVKTVATLPYPYRR